MAISIIDQIQEEARRVRATDNRYYERGVWVFRLVTKPNAGGTGPGGEVIFPLPLPPDRFEYTLPYASTITPAQEQGVVVEEGGIVIGEISLSATTGWKLKRDLSTAMPSGEAKFTSDLGNYWHNIYEELSGQVHFWVLANRCFENYSSLKQDPETADRTHLELHVIKDELHLEIVPRNFRLTRESGRDRVTYRFDCTLAVIGDAEDITVIIPDEKSFLDNVRDAVRAVKDSIQKLAATVDDVTAAIDEISRTIKGIASVIDDIGRIIQAGEDLVNGVKSFLETPASFINSVASTVETMADFADTIDSFPRDVGQTFRNAVDNLNSIRVASRNLNRPPYADIADEYNAKTEQSIGANLRPEYQTIINNFATAAADSGGALTVDQAFGGAIKPGDLARQDVSTPENRLTPNKYNGFEERVVGQGDTIQSLAAKHIGDARLWLDLVTVNDLKPPYITAGAKLPGTLAPGDPIIVPIARATEPAAVLSSGTGPRGIPQAETFLGRDFELSQTTKGRFGWSVDLAHGATDGNKIFGVSNLGQGIESRLRTTRGHNILFPNVGMPRVIGVNQTRDTLAEANFRARQQLLADPRVDKIRDFSFEVETDAISIRAKVQPVGFDTTRVISRTIV
jgi:hypothetical protein